MKVCSKYIEDQKCYIGQEEMQVLENQNPHLGDV